MAKVIPHSLLAAISGKSGDLVFRRQGAHLVAAQAADRSERPATAGELERQGRFRAASQYAKAILADPWQQRFYQAMATARGARPQLMLIADFLNAPRIEAIDTTGYGGRPGDLIRVLAIDDLQVASVQVALHAADGAVIEQGAASDVHGVWQYRATVEVAPGTPVRIVATARDRPGNEATESTTHVVATRASA